MIKIDNITEEKWNSVNPINKKIVEEFLEQSVTLSDQTLKQYRSALQIYFYWIKENSGDKSFHEIKPKDFLFYQNWLSKMEQSSSSIRLKRSAISSINSYIELYYLDEYKDFRNYVTKAIALPPPSFVHEKNPPTLEEYHKLCRHLEEKEEWQKLAYLKFSFETGARKSEVRQLLKEVVDYEPRVIDIDGIEIKIWQSHKIRGKGKGKIGKIRTLQFGEDAFLSLKKWIEIRGIDECDSMFVTKSNGKYVQVGESTFNSWNESFEPVLGRRIHPHIWREARGTSMVLEQGKDINSVKKLLGHNSVQTSEIYVIRKDKDNADDAFS